MNTFFISLMCCFFLNLHLCAQTTSNNSFHPFSSAYGITAEVGGSLPKTDYKIDELAITGRLSVDYFFISRSSHAFGISISGGGGQLKGETFSNEIVYPPVPDNFNTDYFFIGGGFIYALAVGASVPYIECSASYISFNPLDEYGYQLPNNQYLVYDNGAMLYSLETGIRFPFSENWSLNLGANYNFSSTDYLDDVKAGNNNDGFFTFFTGISFYFGKDHDTDNDRVTDDLDLCPDTPDGIEVNEFGCSVSDLKSKAVVYDSLKDHFLMDGIFSDGNLYCFQVDVFQDISNAENLKNEIVLLGYNADIFRIEFGSRDWYSVRIGYFNSFDNAKIFRDNFFRTTNLKLK